MSAAVFFSGGLDSAVLAWDLVMFPERYGIYKESLCGDGELLLLAYTFGLATDVYHRLNPLLAELEKAAVDINVRLMPVRVPDGWTSFKNSNSGHVFSSLSPLASQLPEDLQETPFTPGIHTWLASYAINELDQSMSSPFHGPQAFFGFQWESHVWQEYDAGNIIHNDTSLDFIDSLNEMSRVSRSPVVFQAPFLENRMNKEMIVRHGHKLGVPFQYTSSCIRGWMKDCGKCNQCMLRHAALRGV